MSVLQGRSVCTVTTVGVHSCGGRCAPSVFPLTATDAPAACPGLTRAAGSSVHPRAPARRPGNFPGSVRAGKGGCADDWGGPGGRDACGAGGAWAGRPRVHRRGARPGAPVRGRGSTARGRAFRQQYPAQRLACPGETVTFAAKTANDVIRVEVTDLSGPGVPEPRPAGSDADDGRGLQLVALAVLEAPLLGFVGEPFLSRGL